MMQLIVCCKDDITNIDGPLENWRHDPNIPDFVKLYLEEKDIIFNEENKHANNQILGQHYPRTNTESELFIKKPRDSK